MPKPAAFIGQGLQLLLLAASIGCGDGRPRAAPCGIAALAGPTALLTQFSVPQQTLGTPPANLPERLVVRLVAGPAYRGVVGRSDSLWIIGVDGPLPAGTKPAFGVLVMDQKETARGVLLYEAPSVEGAPQIGTVSVGSASLPLIGIELNPAKIEDPQCPFFPDSVLR
jgi:hypothetical protein